MGSLAPLKLIILIKMREIKKCYICKTGEACFGKEITEGETEVLIPQLREDVLVNNSIYDCPIFRQKIITIKGESPNQFPGNKAQDI